jgi:Peptidase M10 serralysin C terminal
MATFKITPAKSVFINVPKLAAFAGDTPAADTLIVDPSAFLISTGLGGIGAELANTKAWTVTVNGSISGDLGIHLSPGNPAVSTITIGVNGEVQGQFEGIVVSSSANINNAGEISVDPAGIGIELAVGGTHTITNSGTGTIDGIFDASGVSNDTVHNSGSILGKLELWFGDDTVTNSGVVLSSSAVLLGEGTNHLTNSGRIFADIFGGSGADTVTNSHLIDGTVELFNGNNTLTNSGTISGGFHGGATGKDTLINSGTIGGDVLLLGGQAGDKVINSGTIGGDVIGGIGPDTVTDYAIVGDVIKSGSILGDIDLDAGDDKFTGGSKPERVLDDKGADFVALGGGSDTYIATGAIVLDGIDIVRGGLGIDTYDASGAIGTNQINLAGVEHLNPLSLAVVAANTASGTSISGTAKDTIFGFENARGGTSSDLIFGSEAANQLDGNGSFDNLFGFGGNDALFGGAGGDTLAGGAGRDFLQGGTEPDVFYYSATTDSGVTNATRDLILDFEDGIDRIDLHPIDAIKTNAATNDAFTFIGTNVPFTGAAGQLRAYWSAIGQIVEGDVNGDKTADFSIELQDPVQGITLTSTDFFL